MKSPSRAGGSAPLLLCPRGSESAGHTGDGRDIYFKSPDEAGNAAVWTGFDADRLQAIGEPFHVLDERVQDCELSAEVTLVYLRG